jgi:hypothetical protein
LSGRLIPLYQYDGSYLDHVTAKRAERLEVMGRAKVVRHKKGHVNRVILYRRPDDPKATALRDYQGQAYSFEQPLEDGHHCWKLRPLQGGRSDLNLAPEDLRPIFTRVLRDCLTPAA